MICKTQHRKLQTEQLEPTKNRVVSTVYKYNCCFNFNQDTRDLFPNYMCIS
jgi:hypothetical protein